MTQLGTYEDRLFYTDIETIRVKNSEMTVIMNGNTIGLLDSLIRNEKNSKRAGEGNKKNT